VWHAYETALDMDDHSLRRAWGKPCITLIRADRKTGSGSTGFLATIMSALTSGALSLA
jgi:hypothetical protein